jgi:superfamily I DNA and RNA helicase
LAFDVVRGNITNVMVTERLIDKLNEFCNKTDVEGTLFTGYPLSANAESKVSLDALLISRNYGLTVFSFSNSIDPKAISEEQNVLFFQLMNNLTKYPNLRKGKGLAFNPIIISIVPSTPKDFVIEDEYIATTIEGLEEALGNIEKFDEKYFEVLSEALQRVATIKPRKKRDNVVIEGSKGDIIKKIEKEIANLDKWQKKAALEIVEGPQRIRGLAGSGKTIVLALKAAYLHTENPDWEIAITYYTRTLWQQYRDLINRFVIEFSGDEPNWDKIHIYHSWGSPTEEGVYSVISKSINSTPVNYSNASVKYGRSNAFKGICDELVAVLPNEYEPKYDAFFIDEAQDMPASFFKLAYKATKDPKRVIWAYDELQNLSSSTMPSIEEMFGRDEQGKLLIELKNEPNKAQQDIILPVCYRNPPWALALAHSLGFGIYRKPLVQHFDDLALWEDIGYSVEKGTLKYGKNVSLTRGTHATPKYFSELLKPQDVIIAEAFNNIDAQYKWVAEEIKKNIEEDELDPDDILVIFPNVITAKNEYYRFARHLNRFGLSSILTGVTHERDIFKISGSISCSSIYRAKGNEAPMVYLINADSCFNGIELIKLRNTLFTSITRSRAWIRICGVGEDMQGIIREMDKFIEEKYTLTFKIPTEAEMKELRTIHRERTEAETKRIQEASKGLKTLIELANKGELDPSLMPEFEALMQIVMKKKMSITDEEDE